MAQNRGKSSSKVKGGPPCPQTMLAYAEQAPERLRAMADDPETPAKIKVEIEQWFFETVYGKNVQPGETREIQSMDLSQLTDQELELLADQADE